MPAPPPSNKSRWQPLLRRVDQACLAFVVGLSLLAITGYWLYQWRVRGGLIEIEQTPPQPIAFQVDVNEAPWPELTLLPGIGEALAKSIVESRERNGPFRSHEELRRVRGIGPKTLDKIKPFLLPIEPRSDVANTFKEL